MAPVHRHATRATGVPHWRNHAILLAVLAVWFAWRCWTLTALDALPDPREGAIADEVLRVRSGVSPRMFQWPGTPWILLLALLSKVMGADGVESIAWLSRFATLPFAAATLVAVWMIGARVVGAGRAWIPAVLLAVAPAFSSGEGNFGLVDHPALALSTVGVLIAGAPRGERAHAPLVAALLAGAFVGLGGAVKYTTLIVALPASVLLWNRCQENGRRFAAASAALIAAVIVGFVVGCPFVLTGFGAENGHPVFAGLAYEAGHYRLGHFGLISMAEDRLWSSQLRHGQALIWSVGGLMAVVAPAVAVIASLRRRLTGEHLALLAWIAVGVGGIVAQRFSFPRHWLIVLPPVFLLATIGVTRSAGWTRRAAGWALVAATVHSAAASVVMDGMAHRPATISRCDAWLREAVARSDPRASVSPGPSLPVLRWLYPGICFDGSSSSELEDADFVVVAALEGALQTKIAEAPNAFREADFFPLTRSDFRTGGFHRRLLKSRAESRQEARAESHDLSVVARFLAPSRTSALMLLFGTKSLPFPLNALHHPDIVVYGRSAD